MAPTSKKLHSKPHGKTGKFAIPKDWTFKDKGVARGFDAHVREQLPWYDLATGIVAHIARQYVPDNGVVIDVGASTGNVGRALAATLTARNAEFHPVDASPEMLAVYDGPGNLIVADVRTLDLTRLRDGETSVQPDLVVAFLALMFVPVRDRSALVERVRSVIAPGGAFVVFDKMEPRGGHLGTAAYRLTLAAKHEAGASAEDVIAKELSLAGLQRPMSELELRDFVQVFRFGDFAGWVYEKPIA